MTYDQIRSYCRKGKIGKIPGWKGYIKWDYNKDQLVFTNEDYVMNERELQSKIGERKDLYYII